MIAVLEHILSPTPFCKAVNGDGIMLLRRGQVWKKEAIAEGSSATLKNRGAKNKAVELANHQAAMGGSSQSASNAYRMVILDRVAHWGEKLATANNTLRDRQEALAATVRTISQGTSPAASSSGAPQPHCSGLSLFCHRTLSAEPELAREAMAVAAKRGKGSSVRRFAASWLVATLVSRFRELMPAAGGLSDIAAPNEPLAWLPKGGSTDEMRTAYERLYRELERRKQEDLEGLVLYSLSKANQLAKQQQRRHDDEMPVSIMGVGLEDIVHYPPTGLTSFSIPERMARKSDRPPPSWVRELASILAEIPNEWAALPRDVRAQWTPRQRHKKNRKPVSDEASNKNADRERAAKVIKAALKNLRRRKQRAITSGAPSDGHKAALEWLLRHQQQP